MHSNATSPAGERSRATHHRKASQIENAPKRNRSSNIYVVAQGIPGNNAHATHTKEPIQQDTGLREGHRTIHQLRHFPGERCRVHDTTQLQEDRSCIRKCWVNHKTTLSHLRSKRAFKENAAAYSCTAPPTREPYCQLCMKSTQRQRSHTLRTTSSRGRTTARVMRCALA